MGKAFLNKYITDTPEPYQFVLTNSQDKSEVLDVPPMEWAGGFLEAKRRLDVGGVIIGFVLDSLTFIKKGNDFIRKEWAINEFNSIMNLTVYEFVEENEAGEREYEAFPTPFSLNFETYAPVKVGSTELQAGVKIQAVSNANVVKFDKRKKTKLDLTKSVSIGGFNIVPYSNLRKNVNVPEISIIDTYRSSMPGLLAALPRNPGVQSYASLNMGFTGSRLFSEYYSDFAEAVIVPAANKQTLSNAPAFFDTAIFEYVGLKFQYGLDFQVSNRHTGTPPWEVYLYEVDSSSNIITTHSIGSFGNSTGLVQFSGTITIDIALGNSLKFVVLVHDISGIKAESIGVFAELRQEIANSPEVKVEGMPIYEALETSVRHMLDSQYPFYSEKFGRTDTPYNLDGDTYLSEDQKTFISVMGGLNFRGSPLSDENTPIPASFDDLFKSASAMYNLGYTFELRDGFFRLRIEDYDFFFDDDVVLDLRDRLTDLDLEGKAMPKLAYLDIETGYAKFEYVEINGRGEFNSSSSRTSIINTSTKFDNKSKARADTRGITTLLGDSITENGTQDQKGDNDLFFLKTQEDGSEWKPEKEENITIEDDSSIFRENTFNLFLTPTRNLIRQGNKLKASLIKFVSSVLRFQIADKKQTLRTTGEGYTITENEDILVDDLADPIYKPFQWTVIVKLTYTERKAFLENPQKRIIFTDEVSGWVLSYKRKNATDEVELTIIEKYVN